jgi:hypothetical protein
MFDPVSLVTVVIASAGSAGISGFVNWLSKRSSRSPIILKSASGTEVALNSEEKLSVERVNEIASALTSDGGSGSAKSRRRVF